MRFLFCLRWWLNNSTLAQAIPRLDKIVSVSVTPGLPAFLPELQPGGIRKADLPSIPHVCFLFSKKRFFHLSRCWFQPKARRGLFWLQTLQLNWVVVSRNLERFYAKHMLPAWSMPLPQNMRGSAAACVLWVSAHCEEVPRTPRTVQPHCPQSREQGCRRTSSDFHPQVSSQRPTGTHAFCSSTSASKVLFIFCEQIKSSVRMFTNFNGTSATQIQYSLQPGTWAFP